MSNSTRPNERTAAGLAPSGSSPKPLSFTEIRDLPAATPLGVTGPGASLSSTPRDHSADTPSVAGEPRPISLAAGDVLADRYEIRRLLGTGGMGAVFAAYDRLRKEEIAVKVLHAALLADPKARERFVQEATLASHLAHPQIVRVFNLEKNGNTTFLCMELLKGRNLREKIVARQERNQRFDIDEVRSLGRQLCDALAYAHQQGVAHLDVKPENVWVLEDESVKLMDFGIARLLTPGRMATTRMAMGTAYYMAPEQLKAGKVDGRADQFALAVVLYELLTDEVPQGAVQAPHELRKSVPESLSKGIMKALSGPPERRFADLTEFEQVLERNRIPWSRRVRRAALASALFAIVILGLTSPRWWPAALHDAKRFLAGSQVDQGEKARHQAEEAQNAWQTFADSFSAARKKVKPLGEARTAFDQAKTAEDADDYATAAAQYEVAANLFGQALHEGQDLQRQAAALATVRHQAEDARKEFEDLHKQQPSQPLSSDAQQAQQRWAEGEQALADVDYARSQEAFAKSEQHFAAAVRGMKEDLSQRISHARTQAEASFNTARAVMSDWETTVRTSEQQLQQAEAGRSQAIKAIRKQELDRSIALRDGLKNDPLFESALEELTRTWKQAVAEEHDAPAQALSAVAAVDAASRKVLSLAEKSKQKFDDERKTVQKRAEALAEEAQGLLLQHRSAAAHDKYAEAIALTPDLAKAYAGRAWASVEQEDYPAALSDCDEAQDLSAELPSVHTLRGWALLGTHDRAQAKTEFRAAIHRLANATKPLEIYFRAAAYSGLGDAGDAKSDDRAVADFTLAIQGMPERACFYAARAFVYYRQRHYELALVDLDKAISLEPDHGIYYVTLGYTMSNMGHIVDAEKAYQEAIERLGSEDNPSLRARGDALLATGDRIPGSYDQALAAYDAVLRNRPEDVDAVLSRGRVLAARHNWDAAILACDRALQIDAQSAQAYGLRGGVLFGQHKYQKAVEDYTKAIQLQPWDWWLYRDRGTAWGDLKETTKARADFEEALRLVTQHQPADFVSRGDIHMNLGDYSNNTAFYDQAVAEYGRAIDLDPKHVEAYRRRGNAFRAKKEFDQAIADHTHAINLDPKSASVYVARGKDYDYGKKDYDRAIADYTKAIELNPMDAEPYHCRGAAYHLKKDYDRAIADYTKAIELDPTAAGSYQGRGEVYNYGKKNFSQAIADYTKAIELNPMEESIYWGRGGAYEELKADDRAIADLTKAIDLNPKNAFSWFLRASAYFQAGGDELSSNQRWNDKLDHSQSDCRQALSLDPNDQGALKLMRDLAEIRR